MSPVVCPILKKQTFLVASDGSEFSANAIREAINLAKICSSTLIAISVIKTNLEFESVLPQVVEKDEEEAKKYLESVRAQAIKNGVDCTTIVTLSEEPYRDIVDYALQYNADMVIMGTHGRTGIKRLMMGSVTAKVIGHASCNVLVFPLHASMKCSNIMIATDGSPYGEAAASEAIGIAKRCGSTLIILSVASSDAEIGSARVNVDSVLAAAEKEGIHAKAIVATGKPYESIIKTAEQHNADLIVVGSHGRTGLNRLLMGSVTERVIGHAATAVLVVKKPQ